MRHCGSGCPLKWPGWLFPFEERVTDSKTSGSVVKLVAVNSGTMAFDPTNPPGSSIWRRRPGNRRRHSKSLTGSQPAGA